jgi:uncharacterized OB-fold protein
MDEPTYLPLPTINPDNAEFWRGCKNRQLILQRCRGCGKFRYYPRPACSNCSSMEFDWQPVSGRGTVFSYVIVHGPTLPYFAAKAPYNVVLVALEEGPHMVSNLLDVPNDEIYIGMPVVVDFEDVSEEFALPKFRRAT